MDLGLAGKTIIVTGGGANIGRAISLAFAREGSNVVIAELDEAQGKKVADEINAMKAGGRCLVVKTDVTKLAEVEGMFKKALDEFGKVDVLVNNVGWDMVQLFTETAPEFWDKVVALNYRSDLNCIKTALPHMIERKNGSIISIGSDAGRVGEFREAVYSGCKAGVIALSKAIAKEVGRYGIRLNVVCPGVTVPSPEEIGEGSMWKGEAGKIFTPEVQEKIARNYPLRRLGKGGDVASAVVFLASDAASFITGQTLSVSGGYSMM
jgi:NAD(P)-dependent dehydrogenase (short-subunit alcohol dehydrogenase family)